MIKKNNSRFQYVHTVTDVYYPIISCNSFLMALYGVSVFIKLCIDKSMILTSRKSVGKGAKCRYLLDRIRY